MDLQERELYGAELYKAMQAHGYDSVASGSGPWVDGVKVIETYIFYQLGGAATVTTFKSDAGGPTVRSEPQLRVFGTQEGLDGFIRQHHVTLQEPRKLTEMLQ